MTAESRYESSFSREASDEEARSITLAVTSVTTD